MKKIIDGEIYDTACSTVDKKFTSGIPGDETGWEETLYVTPEGRFFIYTNGGKLSRYPREDITPIQREKLKDWILSH